MVRNCVIGEYEVMLKSSPGKGIIDTEWDQIHSSIFVVCLTLKKNGHPLRKCEKRTVSGSETTRRECHTGPQSFQ